MPEERSSTQRTHYGVGFEELGLSSNAAPPIHQFKPMSEDFSTSCAHCGKHVSLHGDALCPMCGAQGIGRPLGCPEHGIFGDAHPFVSKSEAEPLRCGICEAAAEYHGDVIAEIPNEMLPASIANIKAWAERKGWWDVPGTTGETVTVPKDHYELLVRMSKLLLMHCEISEAVEELRVHGLDMSIRYEGDNQKPEGYLIELADLDIRLRDELGHDGITDELWEEAKAIKMAYNEKRPYRHGNKLA